MKIRLALACQRGLACDEVDGDGGEVASAVDAAALVGVAGQGDRPDVDRAAAGAGVRAVLTTLREAVTRDQFEDTVGQLPNEFRQVIEPVGAGGGRQPGPYSPHR